MAVVGFISLSRSVSPRLYPGLPGELTTAPVLFRLLRVQPSLLRKRDNGGGGDGDGDGDGDGVRRRDRDGKVTKDPLKSFHLGGSTPSWTFSLLGANKLY